MPGLIDVLAGDGKQRADSGTVEGVAETQVAPAAAARAEQFPDSADQARPAVGQVFAERYRVERLIGRGGMGDVFVAHDERVGDHVALKLLRLVTASAPGGIERFRREVRLARRITSPHVARIHDLGEWRGQQFLTMEYVDGDDLSENAAWPLQQNEVVRIGVGIAEGLVSAHAVGVVHRDLKPANVLIERDGGRVVITDFGIAHGMDENQTLGEGRQIVGTPAYMAPEQILGEPIDGRADVYSLGVLLFQLLTGRLPCDGDSAIAIAHARVNEPPRKVLDTAPGTHPELAAVIDHCLRKMPAQRIGSAAELLGRLQEISDEANPALDTMVGPSPQSGTVVSQTTELSPNESGLDLPLDQRRLAVVVQAGIAEYARLSADLDPDELVAVIDAFAELAGEIANELGGVVHEQRDAAFSLLFGAARSHGGEARRAVRAATRLHERMAGLSSACGVDVRARVGIAHSDVAIRRAGNPTTSPGFVLAGRGGRVVSALESAARGGETWVSAQIAGADRASVTLSEPVLIAIPDHDAPVEAFVARTGDAPATTMGALCGRDQELETLCSALSRLRETRRGALCLVSGVAGIGKSRLVAEIIELADEAGLETRSTRIVDFGARRGRLRSDEVAAALLSGNASDLDAHARASAVTRAIGAGILAPGDEIYALSLLDVPLTPHQRNFYEGQKERQVQRRQGEVLVSLFRNATRDVSWVLAVEDLHWADGPSRLLLLTLARELETLPLLLVITARPESDLTHQIIGDELATLAAHDISLRPLDSEGARQLAVHLDVEVSAEHLERCLARADGNPLFLEQLLAARAVDDDGAALPETVQSLIQARTDRLDPSVRHSLQACAVLGQTFPTEWLYALHPGAPRDAALLERLQFLRRNGPEIRFAHALVRDGVYASLTAKRRRALHGDAAEIVGEYDLALRALHLELARDERAAGAYLEAGNERARAFDGERALELFNKGLELAGAHELQCALFRARGQLHFELSEYQKAYDDHHASLQLATDDDDRCRALVGMAGADRWLWNPDRARGSIDEALPIARRCGLAAEEVELRCHAGMIFNFVDSSEKARAEFEQALDLAKRTGSLKGQAWALSCLGDHAMGDGRFAAGHRSFQGAVACSVSEGLVRYAIINRVQVANSLFFLGKRREALETLALALDGAEQINDNRAELLGQFVMHSIATFDCRGFAADFERFLASCRCHRNRRLELMSSAFHVLTLARRGERGHALERARDLVADTRRELPVALSHALGALALATDDTEERARALAELHASGSLPYFHVQGLRIAIEGCLNAGELEDALALATELEAAREDDATIPICRVWVDAARVVVRLLQSELSDETVALARALQDRARRDAVDSYLYFFDHLLPTSAT